MMNFFETKSTSPKGHIGAMIKSTYTDYQDGTMHLKDKSRLKSRLRKELIKRGIKRASLFGSVVRNEDTEHSDIDVLIEPKEGMTLLDLSGMKMDLEEILGTRVDLITYNSLDPRLKRSILSEQEVII